MTRNLDQRGFSFTIITLTIAVIAAIVLGAWYISDKGSPDKSSKASSNGSRTKQPPKVQPETASDPSEGGKYLLIKEWNVRLLLPDKLRGDAYYDGPVVQTATPYPHASIESVNLRSKALDQVTIDCDGEKFYLQSLARSKSKLAPNEYEYLQADLNFIQLGGYWYTSVEPGNQSSKTQKCRDSNQVSEKKDGFWISVGGAQAIYDSIHTMEEMPNQ